MPEQTITVPYENGELTMSRRSAIELMKGLKKRLSETPASREGINPLAVSEDGYFTQAMFCDFLAQVYPGEAVEGRVRRIFRELATGGKSRAVNIGVRCRDCKNEAGKHCTAEPLVNHHIHFEKLEINLASLAKLDSRSISSISGIGPASLKDIRLVLSVLS